MSETPEEKGQDMAEQAELDAILARLEAAMTAASKTISETQTVPDLSEELSEARTELAAAEKRIADLEAEIAGQAEALEAALAATRAAEARAAGLEADLSEVPAADLAPVVADAEVRKLRETLAELSTTVDDLRAGAGEAGDAILRAEIAALRAARELDMAEMHALLAELEPMLEQANA